MIILITGSRNWPWPEAVHAELDAYFEELEDESLLVVQGEAEGVDTFAKEWARYRKKDGLPIDEIGFRPNYEKHSGTTKRAAPKIRNQDMVDYVIKHSDPRKICLAFQYGAHCGGTQDCIERAEFATLEVRVHYLSIFDR